jgi:hypothetical protein
MRARGEDLRRAGVEFLDAASLFAEERPSAFDGPSRLTPQGERLLGARIAALFLAAEGG